MESGWLIYCYARNGASWSEGSCCQWVWNGVALQHLSRRRVGTRFCALWKKTFSLTLPVACCQARLLSRRFICRLGKNWWRKSIRLLWYMKPMWFPGRLSHNVCYCAGGKKAAEYGLLWCHPSAATGKQGELVPSRLTDFICPFTGSVTYLIKCSLKTRLQTEFHP